MLKILQSRLGLIAITVCAYSGIFALEVLTSDEPMSLARLALELLELALLSSAIIGLAHLMGMVRRETDKRRQLLDRLNEARSESAEWRNKAQAHLNGLMVSINDQCDLWELTPAEREVSFLMLKGLSHKEIALLRNTHESTVRQQARSIYSKSGLDSRRSFCAYFLDDLLPSHQDDLSQDRKIVDIRGRKA